MCVYVCVSTGCDVMPPGQATISAWHLECEQAAFCRERLQEGESDQTNQRDERPHHKPADHALPHRCTTKKILTDPKMWFALVKT